MHVAVEGERVLISVWAYMEGYGISVESAPVGKMVPGLNVEQKRVHGQNASGTHAQDDRYYYVRCAHMVQDYKSPRSMKCAEHRSLCLRIYVWLYGTDSAKVPRSSRAEWQCRSSVK